MHQNLKVKQNKFEQLGCKTFQQMLVIMCKFQTLIYECKVPLPCLKKLFINVCIS